MEVVAFGMFLLAGATWIGVFGSTMESEKVRTFTEKRFGSFFFLLVILWASFGSLLIFLVGLAILSL